MRRILWFRRDLRVKDNPLLSLDGEVLPIFIFDTNILQHLKKDDKRVSFIFHYVAKLKRSLQDMGLDLKIFSGKPADVFKLLDKCGFDEVAASGDYDNYARQRDLEISHILPFRYIHDTYIFKLDEILKEDGTPYLVFTPFYNKAKSIFSKEHLTSYVFENQTLFDTTFKGVTKVNGGVSTILPFEIKSLGFEMNLPKIIDPYKKLHHFAKYLPKYAHDRDIPWLDSTSALSVDLRFGTISIRSVLHFLVVQKKKGMETEAFFRQLIFRDFYAYLLFYFPYLATDNHKYRFNGIADDEKYAMFCEGRTGVPIVDAGVRELLQTGLMHNRVRMICASFFTKDLLLPWQWGESFFAKHLLDYDAASNILSWQWSAGTGIDPQPYFRIFNPYLQAKKFDKDAVYIKKWLPELAHLNPKNIHDESYLLAYEIKGYPKPRLIHKEASQKALAYFKQCL
ncbi:MAG: deoxyribodipyrimidine photo-lyase [Campylobacterales bacterium]|nr:deoxyribodipyrimidine photo-lyase [Campylobacterales bacterium]